MRLVILGPNTSHPSIATSVTNLARAYQKFGQVQKALLMHKQSLHMRRAIYGTNAAHPEIVHSFPDLSNLHTLLGSVQKANHYQQKSFEISRVIRDRMSAVQCDLAANNEEVTEMRVSCQKG